MKKEMIELTRLVFITWLFLFLPGCTKSISPSQTPGVAYPEGKILFETYCIDCHGKEARGSEIGPPLVHEIYRPDHHGDGAFYRAIQKGVEAHHWQFGDMPAIPEIKTKKEADQILQYVRALQRQAGIR